MMNLMGHVAAGLGAMLGMQDTGEARGQRSGRNGFNSDGEFDKKTARRRKKNRAAKASRRAQRKRK